MIVIVIIIISIIIIRIYAFGVLYGTFCLIKCYILDLDTACEKLIWPAENSYEVLKIITQTFIQESENVKLGCDTVV